QTKRGSRPIPFTIWMVGGETAAFCVSSWGENLFPRQGSNERRRQRQGGVRYRTGVQLLDEPEPADCAAGPLIPSISLVTATAFDVRAIRRNDRCDPARLKTRTPRPASSLSPAPARSERDRRNRNDPVRRKTDHSLPGYPV